MVLGSPEGEPKVFARAFMPLRSLRPSGSCPDTAARPISCRPRGEGLPLPTSTPTCRRETHPQPAFFIALHATISPADCSFETGLVLRGKEGRHCAGVQSAASPRLRDLQCRKPSTSRKGAEDEHPTTREVIHFPKLSAQNEIRPTRFGKPASVRNRLQLWLATQSTYRRC